jgi:hypothetical protein
VAPINFPTHDFLFAEPPTMRVVYDGSAYLVAWLANDNSVQAQRIDPASGALLGAPMTLATCVGLFDLGVDDAGPLLVSSPRCAPSRITAQRLGVGGPVGAPVAISPVGVPDTLSPTLPRMAWNGEEWLVVWEQEIALPFGPPGAYRGNIYAQRFSSALAVIDTQPIAIAVSGDSESDPLVASDGRDFLVTWTHVSVVSGIEARRVSADGTTSPVVMAAQEPAGVESIAWDGARYAIAYATGTPARDLLLTHVTRDGAATGDRVVVSATETDEGDASLIAPAGGALRVAYTRVAPEPVYGGVARAFAKDSVTRERRRPRPH